jgi:rhodanese-related sulfurtransferase
MRTIGLPVVAMIFGGGTLWSFLLVKASTDSPLNTEELRQGETLYSSFCQRCHGPDGDDIDYPNIIPLSGFGRRPMEGRVAQVSDTSYFAWGNSFEDERARLLTNYLKTLKGQKGFKDPGWLVSPYVLNRKGGFLDSYRVVDVRSASAYQEGHISNAVSRPASGADLSTGTSPITHADLDLSSLGITSDTLVVIYDQQSGIDAAGLWWEMMRLGHDRTAILDGGWKRWLREGYLRSTYPKTFSRSEYVVSKKPFVSKLRDTTLQELDLSMAFPNGKAIRFDWRQTQGDDGFHRAEEIETYLLKCGFQTPAAFHVKGKHDELGYLIFVMHLLGHTPVQFDSKARILEIDNVLQPPLTARSQN